MITELKLIKNEWESVYNDSTSPSIFLNFDFVENFYQSFAKPEDIKIVRIEADGQAVGFLPLVASKEGSLSLLESLTTSHCLHSGALTRTGYESQTAELIIKKLLQESSEWDKIQLSWEYSFDSNAGFLSDDLLNRHDLRWHRRTEPTYTIKLSQPFDKFYNNELSKKLRKNLKMYGNKLSKDGGGEFVHFANESALEHLDEFFKIEHSGWKGKAGSSILSRGDKLRDYYSRLASQLSHNGLLLMSFLKHKNEFIAAVFGYIDRDVYHYSKIGFQEEYSRFSPSNLLLVDIMKYLISNRPEVTRVHLFPESAGYKQRWTNETSQTSELLIYNSSWRGKIADTKYNLKETVKKIPFISSIVKSVRDKVRR